MLPPQIPSGIPFDVSAVSDTPQKVFFSGGLPKNTYNITGRIVAIIPEVISEEILGRLSDEIR